MMHAHLFFWSFGTRVCAYCWLSPEEIKELFELHRFRTRARRWLERKDIHVR